MAPPGIVAAFARYKATLTNHQWAVSAEVPGGVVMSLWAHLFKRDMVYEDRLSRWSGNGNALFRKHLELVQRGGLPIHLVIATSSDPAAVDTGNEASMVTAVNHGATRSGRISAGVVGRSGMGAAGRLRLLATLWPAQALRRRCRPHALHPDVFAQGL